MNSNKMPKLFLGPMSLNLVKAVIGLSTFETPIGLIPSRRQVEYDGGYVNNWTTEEFSLFVKSGNSSVILQRDHGGPKQGNIYDDGKESYKADCKSGFDLIHVDPWKDVTSIDEAITKTVDNMIFIDSHNQDILFEIGTEQAIFGYSTEEMDYFISNVFDQIGERLASRVSFSVVQTGTRIISNQNVGKYDSSKMIDMTGICTRYRTKSKEHNGDYLTDFEVQDRFKKGLSAINIAPEMGFNESTFILKKLKEKNMLSQISDWYDLCIESEKWKKWIINQEDKDDVEKIISITGHYTFSLNSFQKIKDSIPEVDLDKQIINHHTNKINKLLSNIDYED